MRDTYRKSLLTKNFTGVDWAKVLTWDSLEEYKWQFDLALLQETRAACFNLLDEDDHCKHDPQDKIPIEIARGHHILFTCKVMEIEDLAKKSVPKEEQPEQVWEKRLRKHAMHSTSVAVVDKFAIDDWQGLRFFLQKLVTDGWQSDKTLQTVDIYSTYTTFNGKGAGSPAAIKSELKAEATQLTKELGAGIPNVRINVNLLHRDNVPHDRWLRFGENIIELGKGLATLESDRKEGLSFQLKGRDLGREDEESV